MESFGSTNALHTEDWKDRADDSNSEEDGNENDKSSRAELIVVAREKGKAKTAERPKQTAGRRKKSGQDGSSTARVLHEETAHDAAEEEEEEEEEDVEPVARRAPKKRFILEPAPLSAITILLTSKLDSVTAADGILQFYLNAFPANAEACWGANRADFNKCFGGKFEKSKTFIWIYISCFYKIVPAPRLQEEQRHLVIKGRGAPEEVHPTGLSLPGFIGSDHYGRRKDEIVIDNFGNFDLWYKMWKFAKEVVERDLHPLSREP